MLFLFQHFRIRSGAWETRRREWGGVWEAVGSLAARRFAW
jgi:hypothetical protein